MPLYTRLRKVADLSDIREPLISLNQYNRPMELVGQDAEIMLITRLILMDPGLIQTHPDMGVGLVSKFRYSQDIDIPKLRARIKNQIETYLPMFSTVEVKVDLKEEEHRLYIYITSDQVNTLIPFDTYSLTVVENLDSMKK